MQIAFEGTTCIDDGKDSNLCLFRLLSWSRDRNGQDSTEYLANVVEPAHYTFVVFVTSKFVAQKCDNFDPHFLLLVACLACSVVMAPHGVLVELGDIRLECGEDTTAPGHDRHQHGERQLGCWE
jgi:hypothetical protein